MRKLIFTIILIVLIVIGLTLLTGYIQEKNKPKKSVYTKIETLEKLPIKLENMGDVECKAYKIPESTEKYLKEKSEFSSIYKHKKFVVYIKDDKLSFAKDYANTLEKISNDKKYQKHYNFATRKAKIKITTMSAWNRRMMKKAKQKIPADVMTIADGKTKLDFIQTCGNFCIVNPAKNQIISLKGDPKKESEKFEYVLDKYKRW